MFGMGFMEIFLVLVVAIVALGPEKLPTAVVDIAKFFKKFKNSIDEAKTSFDNELHIADMKKQADEFKASIGNVKDLARIDLNSINTDKILNDDPVKIYNQKNTKEKKNRKKKKKEKVQSNIEEK
jgi:sec-independent protein translocase protein TatB